MDCAGLLLTGGRSTRMGRDKATIVVNGTTLAARAAAALREVADPVIEVGPGVTDLRALNDEGHGPFAALGAGLQATPDGAFVILLACDMPLVSAELLRTLRDYPSAGSVVPIWHDLPQPLCARWSPAALARVPGLLQDGERSFRSLLAGPDVLHITGADLDDVDTEADLARVTRRGARPNVDGHDEPTVKRDHGSPA
jgi:molybdopterin-guanine dinucleotide biosynthesis protein A